MSEARYIVGDTREVIASLPDGSVDLVLTSPPFLALRSYLPDDHPDKDKEIGSEPTPGEFLDALLGLSAEWRRVLAPHGSICIELGDTYASSSSQGARSGWHRIGKRALDQPSGYRKEGTIAATTSRNYGEGWPLDKSLCGVPTLYAWSLAYGRNLLTGEESPAGPWRVRNLVAWCRPNPPVGALGDKFRPATSYMTIATLDRRRYFDLDADCGHDDWRRGVVLDPFAGSGTTLAVAVGHGRDAIGIDIDERNADLAVERVGPMFLTVEKHPKEAVA